MWLKILVIVYCRLWIMPWWYWSKSYIYSALDINATFSAINCQYLVIIIYLKQIQIKKKYTFFSIKYNPVNFSLSSKGRLAYLIVVMTSETKSKIKRPNFFTIKVFITQRVGLFYIQKLALPICKLCSDQNEFGKTNIRWWSEMTHNFILSS